MVVVIVVVVVVAAVRLGISGSFAGSRLLVDWQKCMWYRIVSNKAGVVVKIVVKVLVVVSYRSKYLQYCMQK